MGRDAVSSGWCPRHRLLFVKRSILSEGPWATPRGLGVVSPVSGAQDVSCALKHKGKQWTAFLHVRSHVDSACECLCDHMWILLPVCVWSHVDSACVCVVIYIPEP